MNAPLILVVEDNETNQMLTVAVLERDGYRVVVAGNADEARQHLKTETPHLILMDVQLPGEDGLALTRQLKRNPATRPIPATTPTMAAAISGRRNLPPPHKRTKGRIKRTT